MYSICLNLLLIFGIKICLCLTSPSSSENGVVYIDDFDLDLDLDDSSELQDDQNVTDVTIINFTNTITPTLFHQNTINTMDVELAAAEKKVREQSAVLKQTIHRIRQQYKKMDIVFLIDSSSSVGKSNFQSELKFVTKFLSDFNVSFNYTRVSILTFSSHENIVCILLYCI